MISAKNRMMTPDSTGDGGGNPAEKHPGIGGEINIVKCIDFQSFFHFFNSTKL